MNEMGTYIVLNMIGDFTMSVIGAAVAQQLPLLFAQATQKITEWQERNIRPEDWLL